MPPAALLLVLAAAVIHAGWNAFTKRAGDPLAFLWSLGIFGALLYAPGALFLLWDRGVARAALPLVIATILLHAVYFFALGRAYRLGDLSVVYPVARGTGVALVPIAARLVFDERLSVLGTTGIVL